MHPIVVIHIWDILISIPLYAFCVMFGTLFAMLMLYQRICQRMTDFLFSDYLKCICCMGVGIALGSHILFVLTRLPSVFASFSWYAFFEVIFRGGFVFYGGLFGAILGLFCFTKFKKLSFVQWTEITAPIFPLFHMFGRIGCFFGGCCYGKEASWGIAMKGMPEIPRIPIQLFESGCLLGIFVFLLWLERRKTNHPNLMVVYLGLYAICRFVLEFFRGDIIRGIWFGLSTSQWISCVVILSMFFCYKEKIGACRIKDGLRS